MNNSQNKISQVMSILNLYDAKKSQNPDWEYILTNVASCLLNKKPLILITFTCSTINSEYMFNKKTPELYVSLDPAGNNLEADLPRLQNLYQELAEVIPIRLIILIGNTDPFYIYTQEGKLIGNLEANIFFKKFNERWQIYKTNLENYIQKNFPKLKVEVISWYQIESDGNKQGRNFRKTFKDTKNNLESFYNPDDLRWELTKLKSAFGPGKYFTNLKRPSQTILKDWVRRKFAEYTTQGLWIKRIFPEAILLQNEKPSDLRTKMYQPLIQKYLNSRLPVLYPYGVDNSDYQ